MATTFTHKTNINADGLTIYTKVAPYASSNNMVYIDNTLAEEPYPVKLFDFVIVANANPGFPGGNGGTASNVMY